MKISHIKARFHPENFPKQERNQHSVAEAPWGTTMTKYLFYSKSAMPVSMVTGQIRTHGVSLI